MEKFGLLNLLKAIDGLNAAAKDTNGAPQPDKTPPASPAPQKIEIPNIMYAQILKHEQMSNRLKNKRGGNPR